MTVYVEYALFTNFVFDLLLLYCTAKLLNVKFRKLRLFAADAFGSAAATVMPLFDLGVFALPAKLGVSAVMIALLARHNGKKKFFAAWLLFMGLTFALGGVLCGIYFVSGQDFALQSDLSVVSSSPLPLFAAGTMLFVFLVRTLAAYMRGKKAADKYVYDVTLKICGKTLALKGFLDSGNRLIDMQSGMPVCVAVSNRLIKRLKADAARQITEREGGVHAINFFTPAGNKKMTVLKSEGLVINGKEIPVALGIAESACGDCDLLLNGTLEL